MERRCFTGCKRWIQATPKAAYENIFGEEKLGEMVEKYNKLVSPNESIQLQEVENGNFPWKTGNNDEDALPIRTKRIVVDKHMEASRFGEELELLQKEMMGFVKFYKNSVLPSLIQQQQNLRDFLKEVDNNGGTRVEESLSHRYSTLSTMNEILMAKLGLVQDGIDFAVKQIAAGIVSFAPVLTDELDELSSGAPHTSYGISRKL